ncbi:hypothetical protein GUJ93_ZPchr0014g47380 [Zizania palustris]|uniref:Uncharacterized protein n=1 Tax=Zizania palustris TaxID=103762 RepID=A0A8J5W0W8_ZIZPA|nr:hypothetical protein GUJ93_ZPchr0014g47380 [Zizania palustris]
MLDLDTDGVGITPWPVAKQTDRSKQTDRDIGNAGRMLDSAAQLARDATRRKLARRHRAGTAWRWRAMRLRVFSWKASRPARDGAA